MIDNPSCHLLRAQPQHLLETRCIDVDGSSFLASSLGRSRHQRVTLVSGAIGGTLTSCRFVCAFGFFLCVEQLFDEG